MKTVSPLWVATEVRTRLLVVDEVEPMRRIIARFLRLEGYEVEQAANTTEVVRLIGSARWDAVVLDIDRPGLNGIELYARILHAYGEVRLPVVFLSCYQNEILRLGLEAASWAMLVRKPCTFDQLLEAVRSCLRQGG